MPLCSRYNANRKLVNRPNYSSISAPAPANVTFHHVENIYAYTAWKLLTAYGIAIALCAITVVLGLISIALNGACYSRNLSTIFVKAKGAETSTHIEDQDLNGRDPLPRYLAKARVHFGAKQD